ncbi:MAG TPA: alpha/beta fold hydrolase [Longimicrobiales bacterium]|nr:alpha/beta fold hydrolase [Longimicrobiales bacterium]
MLAIRPWALGAAVLIAALPGGASAQNASAADTFVVLRGSDTLAVERFSRSAGRLEGTLAEHVSGGQVAYTATIAADESVPHLGLQVHPPGQPESTVRSVTIDLRGDTAVVETPAGPQRLATRAGAFPYINLSFALLEQAVRRARKLGSGPVELPFFIGGQTVPATVRTVAGDTVSVVLGGADLRAVVDAAGRVVAASVPAQGVVVHRSGSSAAPPAAAKPDYSPPAGAPYAAEEVSVPGPGGTLAGTLTLPRARRGRIPAVVTITGSGPQDRDEALPSVGDYRPMRQVADTLSRRGIAVLRLDDRGTGASTGSFGTATSEDFAADIEAAVRWLRARPEIDPARIALLGHSEGGLIAPLVAARDPRVRAIVLMAGPAQTGRQIIEFQQRYAAEHDTALTPARRDSALAAAHVVLDSLATHNAWMRFFLAYDPLSTARKVRAPVLIVQGATDQQVTAAQAETLGAAFRAGGDRDVTVRVFPGHNHLFLADPSGDPRGYAGLPSHRIDPGVLGTVANWLAAKLK